MKVLAVLLVLVLVLLTSCTETDPGFTVIQGEANGDYVNATADSSTNALVGIEFEHHEVHEGDSFSVVDTVAADTTTIKWQVRTANTLKYAHFVFNLSCTGEATFLVTEGSDRTDGTALIEVNRRRVGAPNVAETIVTRTPTDGATDGALILFSSRSGITGAGSKNIEGGTARAQSEWILKPNTKYVVSITTYAASYATINLLWYEHTDN